MIECLCLRVVYYDSMLFYMLVSEDHFEMLILDLLTIIASRFALSSICGMYSVAAD